MPAERPIFYHVDPTEEIAGVLRGIKGAASDAVAIVLPKETRLFRNDVNLSLIAAYARESGKKIALITEDHRVARLAAAHGLQVCAEGREGDNDVTEPQPAVSRVRPAAVRQKTAVIASALLAVALLVYAFLPRVTVVVAPAVQIIEREATIALGEEGASDSGVLMHTAEALLNAAASSAATGRRLEGTVAASGTVIFFNENSQPVHLPAGTAVGTDGGQLYVTTKAVDVPPVKAEYFMDVPVGVKAGQAEAPVQASKPGASGNVAAGRVKNLPAGPKGIRVVNPEPMRGGADRSVTYVTEADIETARKQAVARLHAQAGAAIAESAGPDTYVFTDMLVVTAGQAATQPAAGQEAKNVAVKVSGHARAPYIFLKDVRKSAATLADALAPAGYKRMGAPEVVGLDPVAPAATGMAPDSLQVKMSIPVGNPMDPAAIAAAISGMTPAQARQTLIESGEASELTVKGRAPKRLPRWTPWIKVVVLEHGG